MNAMPPNPALLWRRAKPLAGVPAQPGVVAGLDLSLTSTGFAAIRQGALHGFALAPRDLTGAARLAWFYDEIGALVRRYAVEMVALEGYSFGSRNGREVAGELGGVARLALHHAGVPFMVVPPTSLKMFATGRSNAEKDSVAKELFKRWSVDLDGNDATDAAGLALMAFQRLHCGLRLTTVQQKAMESIVTKPKRSAATGCKKR